MKDEVQYDYDNQAWIVDGVYQDCGCYGRVHAWQKAPSIH